MVSVCLQNFKPANDLSLKGTLFAEFRSVFAIVFFTPQRYYGIILTRFL